MRISQRFGLIAKLIILAFFFASCQKEPHTPPDNGDSGTGGYIEIVGFPQTYKCGSSDLEIYCDWRVIPAGLFCEEWFDGCLGGPSSPNFFGNHLEENSTGILSPLTLTWSGNIASGLYNIFAKWSYLNDSKNPLHISQPVHIAIVNENESAVFADVWSGEGIKGRPSEELKWIHEIAYQILDETGSVNGITVNFTSAEASLLYSSQVSFAKLDEHDDLIANGFVENTVTFPTAAKVVKVKAEPAETGYDKAFPYEIRMFCQNDDEISNLIGNYTHIINTTTNQELQGDGIDDGNDINTSMKDVFIEVDYASSVCSEDEMKEIVNKAIEMLERAKETPQSADEESGIDVHYNFDNSDTILGMPDRLTREKEETYLYEKRTQRNAIHCILGTNNDIDYSYPKDPTDDQLGVMIEFYRYLIAGTQQGGEGWSLGLAYCAVKKFSFSHSKYFLDRCGCFVWVAKIKTTYPDNWKDVAALTMAHEIAHALGMEHTEPKAEFDTNLMYAPLKSPFDINDYNFFNLESLDDCNHNTAGFNDGAMHVRGALGVDNVAPNVSVRSW